jgi:hypothetical protein
MYAMEPLREALIEISRHKLPSTAFLCQLGIFFASALDDAAGNEPMDASQLDQILRDLAKINSNDLGDAVRALRRILQTIRASSAATAEQLPALSQLTAELLGGRLRQQITGQRGFTQRHKYKERDLSCPWFLAGYHKSLLDALEYNTVLPEPVKDYDWEHAENYFETRDEFCNSQAIDWVTRRTTSLVSLPHHLLLHLDRFVYGADGTMEPKNAVMDIPLSLDMTPYHGVEGLEPSNDRYELRAAILYVLDEERGEDDDGGHYVSVVKEFDHWYLVDDDKVTAVTSDSAITDLLSGYRDCFLPSEDRTFITVLVLYCRPDSAVANTLLHELSQQLSSLSETFHGNNCVGRRLRVKWAKEKFYSGVISHYNETSGKHTVVYDDGDVREYDLQKKTIEWLH